MTQAFLTYNIAATGGSTGMSMPDHLAQTINVKDYGAVGDGVTDDTNALQAALNAAYGDYSGTPHGALNYFSNKAVWFPRGNYKVTNTLQVKWVKGARLYGDGSAASVLTYASTVYNTDPSGRTSLFFTNGFAYSTIEGLGFAMNSTSSGDGTIAFNWNWNFPETSTSGNAINTTHVTWHDCAFSNAWLGCSCADPGAALNWGNECDVGSWHNCKFTNCGVGIRNANGNSLQTAVIGSNFTNCGQGFASPSGTVPSIIGTRFSSNGVDVDLEDQESVLVAGCVSNSSKFGIFVGQNPIVGCNHVYSSSGVFAQTTAGSTFVVIIEGCNSEKGELTGAGNFFLDATTMGSSVWYGAGAGHIHRVVDNSVRTFATLPVVAAADAGLLCTISNSSTATWGANVTAGGGANNAAVRWNGTNWTVVGV